MTVTTFDTLKFAKRLKEAGLPEAQAEAQAEAMADAFEANLEELATKGDLKEVRTELREVRTEIKSEIRELELRINAQLMLLKWMLGIVLGGVVSLVVKAFFA